MNARFVWLGLFAIGGVAYGGTVPDAVISMSLNDGAAWGGAAAVDIYLEQTTSATERELRAWQLDFSETDSAVWLVDFEYAVFPPPPCGDLVPCPDLPGTGIVSWTRSEIPGFPDPELDPPYVLPAAGERMFYGTLLVTLPESGEYVLDAMDEDNSNLSEGAQVQFGFGLTPEDPVTTWSAQEGVIGYATGDGQAYRFIDDGAGNPVLVPEPVTWALMGVGGLVLTRRRSRVQ